MHPEGLRTRVGGGHLALWGMAWLAGVAVQLTQPALWPQAVYAVLAGVALAALCLSARLRSPASSTGAAALIALALGALAFATTGLRASWRLADALPPALEGRDLVLVGVVATLPRAGPNGLRFEFDVEQAWLDGAAVALPRRVSLGWFRQAGDDVTVAGRSPDGTRHAMSEPSVDGEPAASPAAELPRAGDRWRLPARLRQPHGALNPHGFDFELWLFERGLRASGSVRLRQPGDAARLGPAPGYPVARWRQQLRDRIVAEVGDARRAGIVAALAVGDQGAVDRDDWALFRATGVIHLMAISGLHVTMFAWLAAAVVGRGWRCSSALMRWLPAPQAARWGGLALATGYAVMAGWGVPAQRTLAMLAVVVALRALGLRWPAGWVLGAAALAVALGDPWALLQPGFWLSFVAVALLMGSLPAGLRAPRPAGRMAWLGEAVRSGLRTQAVATLGLTPLTLLFFQQVSVVGFVANLVAIPLVTLLITPLALAGAAWAPLWSAAAAGVDALAALLAPMAAWPWAVWTAAAAPPWAVAGGLLGGVLAVLPLPWRLRALGLPLLLPLLAPAPSLPPAGRFELVAVDVGQGTAVLLRTRSHLLVYDAGPAWGAGVDAGERVLRPLLQARGELGIDRLLISHPDGDHVGGAASLLASGPVRRLTSTLAADHALRATGVPHEACVAGLAWQWDGVRFEVLHPNPGHAGGTALRPNATSCVLRVEDARGASVLLTGDIEAAQEVALVLGRGAALRSDVLMVPHHGSRTSSTPAFLDAVAPHTAFVQAGYRSRFGHPAPDVLARYAERGVRVVRSDRCGAWTWAGDGAGHCERERRRRYWHHRG
jgi:competence protein ComEC